MSNQNKIIRLASINAATQVAELPEKFTEEKNEIIKKLEEVKLLVIKDGKFGFTDVESTELYEESFHNF